nr:hypothetical protein [Tanacetum cinerariifolium]
RIANMALWDWLELRGRGAGAHGGVREWIWYGWGAGNYLGTKVNVLISNFNHGSTIYKNFMLNVLPENNEFEGEIIPWRVVEVMGSSGGSGEVERSREDDRESWRENRVVYSGCLNVREETGVSLGRLHNWSRVLVEDVHC